MGNEASSQPDPGVLLGVSGWEWPDWEDGFYPADMPPEWRLAYYNTQFSCVFVPAAQWRRATDETLRQWEEDTHGQFLFLLEEVPGAAVPAPLEEKGRCLSAEDARISWIDRHSDIKALAEVLKRGNVRYVLSRDGDLSQLERVRTLLGLLGLMG
jgi:hypothetical protein